MERSLNPQVFCPFPTAPTISPYRHLHFVRWQNNVSPDNFSIHQSTIRFVFTAEERRVKCDQRNCRHHFLIGIIIFWGTTTEIDHDSCVRPFLLLSTIWNDHLIFRQKLNRRIKMNNCTNGKIPPLRTIDHLGNCVWSLHALSHPTIPWFTVLIMQAMPMTLFLDCKQWVDSQWLGRYLIRFQICPIKTKRGGFGTEKFNQRYPRRFILSGGVSTLNTEFRCTWGDAEGQTRKVYIHCN